VSVFTPFALFKTEVAAISATATGGVTASYTSGGLNWRSHTFTSSANLVVTGGDLTVYYLVVGGGGGGGGETGYTNGGGGQVH